MTRSIAHPLSEYASNDMLYLWGPEWNVVAERLWWLNIMDWMWYNSRVYDIEPFYSQRRAAYAAVVKDVDLDSIRERELITHHDVKARIEEFNWLASLQFFKSNPDLAAMGGSEMVHIGLTSADVVDNISLIRMQQALDTLLEVPARSGDQHIKHLLWEAKDSLPLRGIKGPVGTQQDMLDLLRSEELCRELDEYLADAYGFSSVLNSVGQVYPRSIDLGVASKVLQAVQECDNKRPWLTILNGYLTMIASYSGDQWNEGDVSTSAVRRVALPGLFLAADAALRGVKP